MHTKGCPSTVQEPMDECPPEDLAKKQLSFNLDDDLGDDLSLPMDLSTFLEGAWLKSWITPTSSVPMNMDPLQLHHDNDHQYPPIHKGRARLKATVKPSATAQPQTKSQLRGIPDLVDHSNTWIWAQRDRKGDNPCWWKEIRAFHRSLVMPTLSKPEALLLSSWQTMAFRLHLSQHEASGWWDVPPYLPDLHP